MGKRSRKGRIVFWSVVGAAIVLVLLFLAILIPNLIITREAGRHVIRSANGESPAGATAPHAQAAIVLGAGVKPDGTPTPMLLDRLLTGVSLYTTGKVDKIILSGTPTQVPVMLDFVVKRGVTKKDVFTDYEGLDTFLTMYRAVHLYQVKSALLVSQGFHESRAVCIARALGIAATGVVAKQTQPYGFELWKDTVREWAARVKAVLQVHLTHPQPATPGTAMPITGDGLGTRE